MKKISLVILLCVYYQFHLFAADIYTVNPQANKNIYTYGKIWGFLKYYHPEVTSGSLDWDKEFVDHYKSFKGAENKAEFNKLVIDWINSLGEIKGCKTKTKKKDYYDNNFDLDWIKDSTLFTRESSELLTLIETKRGKDQYFVKAGLSGQAIPSNETVYNNFPYEEESYRMLGMVSYWNFVEYYFPYKYLMDQKWDTTFVELIPRFINSRDAYGFHTSMLLLTANIDDSHGLYHNEFTRMFFGEKYISSIFQIIEDKIVLTAHYNDSLSEIDDLKIGDVITHVDGIDIKLIIGVTSSFIPASNNTWSTRPYSIFNGDTDTLMITYVRNGIPKTKTIRRYLFDELKFLPHKINEEVCHARIDNRVVTTIFDGNIGYIRLNVLRKEQIDSSMEGMMNTSGLILDLRGHTQDNFMNELLPYFQSEKTAFSRLTRPDLSYPGRFVQTGMNYCGGRFKKEVYEGQVVVLINKYTLSSSEYLTMALQTAPNVVLIGSQSAGADGNTIRFMFLGSHLTKLTGVGVYYPNGEETQRVGIKPDIVVNKTIKSVISQKDLQLEKAIKYFNQ